MTINWISFSLPLLLATIAAIYGNPTSTLAQHGELCIKTQGGQPCAKTTPEGFPTRLACINAKCQCESPRSQTFNKDLKICQSRAGGHCSNSIEHSCFKYATCQLFREDSDGICVCKKGLIPSRGGRCVGAHGSHCSTNSNCSSKLVCRDEKCSCQDSILQIYHPYLSICQSVVGAICGRNDLCIEGAICQADNDSRTSELSFQTCQCREGYRQVGRKCIANILFVLNEVPVM